MAIRLPFQKFNQEMAKLWRKRIGMLLRSGRGFDGRPLKRKVIPNGRRLGFDSSARGVPGRVERAPFKASRKGFTVYAANLMQDHIFHTGRSGFGNTRPGTQKPGPRVRSKPRGVTGLQVPRPFAAISPDFELQILEHYIRFIEKESKARFK